MTNPIEEINLTDSTTNTASDEALLVERTLCEGPDAYRKIVDRFQGAVFAVALQEDGSDSLLIGDANADLEREDLKRRVAKAISSLGEALRETTILFYMDGYSIGEIATMMRVPVGTVQRRLHDARAKLKSEMMVLIKDTLTSEKPDDEFGDQVYKQIRQYATGPLVHWTRAIHDQLLESESDGFDGLQQALGLSHWKTRHTALKLLWDFNKQAGKGERGEALVNLLKSCLTDPNKSARFAAMKQVMRLDIPMELRQKELMPLVLDMLEDRSVKVRRKVAYSLLLSDYPKHLPLERVALALANEGPNEWNLRILSRLVKKIIATQA